jgi:hypothetical protein
MQRTLKRELKVLEIAKREAVGSSTRTSPCWRSATPLRRAALAARRHQFALPWEVSTREGEVPCSGGIQLVLPGARCHGVD